MAMKLADYTITEAGFGADLGAEKFLDIKCRMAGLKPKRSRSGSYCPRLKYNGGVAKADLNNENLEALEKGMPNLLKHVSNIQERIQTSLRSCHQRIPDRYQGRA